MPRVLLCARHGETDWNAAGRLQGHTDIPLNDAGRAQARALAERVKGARIGAVVSSDMSRARETAEIVAAIVGAPVRGVDADFRERRMGDFEGLTRSECAARDGAAWQAWIADPRGAPPGGEGHAELAARMQAAARRAVAWWGADDAPVLAISHGGAMRALVLSLSGVVLPLIGNGQLVRFEDDGERLVYVA